MDRTKRHIKRQGSIPWGIFAFVMAQIILALAIYVFTITKHGTLVGFVISMGVLCIGVYGLVLYLAIMLIVRGIIGKIIVKHGHISTCQASY